ncbi:membrane protein [Streptomyces albospinus]|uniref:Membrane protein n=1 Tax=Streptomyces albospinus TaxID=285515 RepID=A0ABQ2VLU0_9ACTN|nr:PspC domain-containing protein [Streptomyces albospinus]GGU97102.1 membrane protein [Streptomyces albospinus]
MNDAPPVAEPAASDPTGPTPPAAERAGTLRRSRRHKVVAGVCAGLGRQWDLDPVIFRIVLAVLSVGGLGLIFYGFAWLIIPLDGEEENEGRRLLSGRVEGSALTALLFALVGCGLFLTALGKGSMMSFAIMLTLAVAGSAYWSRQRRRAEAEGLETMDAATAQAVADAPPETQAPPAPNTPSWWRDPRSREAMAGGGYLWGPDTRLDIHYESVHHGTATTPRPQGSWTGAGRPAPWTPPTDPASAAPPKPARAGRPIGGRTFVLAALAGTGAALAVHRHAALAPSLQAGLACALVVFGLGLVLSAWLGRTGGGTVFMMVLTAGLLAVATVLPADITTRWHDRVWAPADIAAVQPHYALGSGDGRLDLSRLPVKNGATVRTSAEVGAGRLQVTLPQGVTTTLHIQLGLGDTHLPGDGPQDVHFSAGGPQRTVTLPADGLKKGEKPHGTLELNLKVGAGQVAVEHAVPGPQSIPSSAPTPQGAPQ